MLDENIEFNEYTCKIDAKSPKRMKKSNVGEKSGQKGIYGGVPRALRIISRHYYYEEKYAVNDIIKVLNLWCGFEEYFDPSDVGKKNHEPKAMYSWLPNYLKLILSKDPEKKELLLADLENRCNDNWNRSVFHEMGNANDINSIYFDRIVADAIEMGPLQKRYLVFEKDPMEGASCWKGKGHEEKNCDRGLKLVAAYLLNKRENSIFSDFDFATYSNWVKSGCASKKKVTDMVIPEFTYCINGGESIAIANVRYIDEMNKKLPLVYFDEDWLKLYKPRLVLSKDIERIKAKGNVFIFEDKGCKYPLQRV